MDKTFLRNFLVFVAILLVSAGTMGYALVSGGWDVEKTNMQVEHTREIILEAEQLSSYIEGILAAQRAYLLTGNDIFIQEYENKKSAISETVARLSELTADNKSQQSRLTEIRNYMNNFSDKLEERSLKYKRPVVDPSFLDDVEFVNGFKNNINRINKAVLAEEYSLLNERVRELDKIREQYRASLLIGLVVGTVLLLMFNTFLFYAQSKRSKTETMLKSSEDRFAMVIEGTQDGIFDYDVRTGQVFYSRRYFGMLGYDREGGYGTVEDCRSLIHPEDLERVAGHVTDYLEGRLSECHLDFRMRHQTGRCVWIQSRAIATFDKDGSALRLVGAHTDITHLMVAQEKLVQEKKEAEDASQAKSEFLAHMSHEIRTPLTAISGIAEILSRQQSNLDDKQKQLVRTLTSSSASLKDLINDILDFSKIESGDIEIADDVFGLKDQLDDVIEMMGIRSSEKGINFVFDTSAIDGVSFRGDAIRLRQILVNLIGNAIKFTDVGDVTGIAHIENREGQPYLRIAVSDTGIGIAPEHFDLVFERFKQADASVSRKYGGTGLGLAISRKLAQLMGGDIYLSSEVGKGSVFTVLLPVVAFGPESGISPHAVKHNRESSHSVLSQQNSRALIVEDYEGNVVVIGFILDDLGIAYDIARNGQEALDAWKSNFYNFILMDVQMPVMDGFTATRTIRNLEQELERPHTPIIGMTAHALVGDKDKCISAGMDSYLPKPVVEADLKKEISRFIGEKEFAA